MVSMSGVPLSVSSPGVPSMVGIGLPLKNDTQLGRARDADGTRPSTRTIHRRFGTDDIVVGKRDPQNTPSPLTPRSTDFGKKDYRRASSSQGDTNTETQRPGHLP